MLNKPLSVAALLAALVPVLAFLLGLFLDYAIPGCVIDEGAGARGCFLQGLNISDAVAVLELGGFVSMFLGIPLAFGLLVLAAIVGFFSRRQPSA